MNLLSRTEELILLAVCNLGENAYGVSIREHLKSTAGQKFSIGGIYVPLDRLVAKGLLKARQGDPTPQRGGMSKRYYTITAKGVRALNEAKRVHNVMWKKVPKLTFAGD
jgi:DNA-binding PadR family transcriptional regulator